MATCESILHEKTFKDQCEDNSRRVFYTLFGNKQTLNPDLEVTRNSKFLALLVVHLQSKGLINEAELDQLLIDTVT